MLWSLNILNNACDAFKQQKIKNSIITIDEYIKDNYVIIAIEDNVGGIQESILKYIFDPYFSTKTKNGTGLGLYISKAIVQDHQKGKIEAFNSETGAVFKISLPMNTCALNE